MNKPLLAPSEPPVEGDWTAPVYAQLPIEPVSGDGAYFTTADGRRILDLYGGHAVACLGYGHPRLTAAVSGQAERLVFQSNAVPLGIRAEAARTLAGMKWKGALPALVETTRDNKPEPRVAAIEALL